MSTPALLGRASYWSSQLIISLIRYFFVMYPIQVYNCLPNNNYKNKIFFKLLRYLHLQSIYLLRTSGLCRVDDQNLCICMNHDI